MRDDHVGELRLRLRTDALSPEPVRDAAEEMVRGVLARCGELLAERWPDRVFLVQRLPLRWSLSEGLLADPGEVEAMAWRVAEALEHEAVPATLDTSVGHQGPLWFEDEVVWQGSHLLAVARGARAWFHAALHAETGGEPFAALARPGARAGAVAVLLQLARADRLTEVLAAQPPAAVAMLMAGWALPRDTGTVGPVSAEARALAAVARRWPALTPPACALALHVHAALRLGDTVVPSDRATVLAREAASVLDTGPREAMPVSVEAVAPSVTGDSAVEHPTRVAGVFHWLGRAQELGIAEALWQVCLPEGAVLAAAARALCDADDAAFAVLAGVGLPDTFAATPDQQAEVTAAVCAELAAALPRRGLAELPGVVVQRVDHPAGHLLVATAEGLPFPFAAWPAGTPGELTAALQHLLSAWPRHAVIAAPPALVQLDPTGRLLPWPAPVAANPWLPAAGTPADAALLATVAGAPATLFALRLAEATSGDAAAFAQRWLRRDGVLQLAPERLDVRLTPRDSDLDLRRAGLDADPGWSEWLRRQVRFVFEEPA